jgi:four helix bundle protein
MKRETRNEMPAIRNASAPDADWVERSHRFAVRIIKMAGHLPRTPAGRSIAGQIVRSAPSVVVNLEEAKGALTHPDTLHKTGIARKEARETLRWLLLIRDAELLPSSRLEPLIVEGDQLVAMLTAGTKRLQERIERTKTR